MKKFIGNVNGVEYNTRDDFNKAVKKAVEENDGTLLISSYEKEVSDNLLEEPEKKEAIEAKVTVICEPNEYVIERESEKKTKEDGTVDYAIPEGLKEKFMECDNKEEVEKVINKKKSVWEHSLAYDKELLKKYQKELEIMTDRCENKMNDIADIEGGIRYYDTLKTFLNSECKCKKNGCECQTKQNDECGCQANKNDNSSIVKSNFWDDAWDELFNFDKFLKKSGFWKRW